MWELIGMVVLCVVSVALWTWAFQPSIEETMSDLERYYREKRQ